MFVCGLTCITERERVKLWGKEGSGDEREKGGVGRGKEGGWWGGYVSFVWLVLVGIACVRLDSSWCVLTCIGVYGVYCRYCIDCICLQCLHQFRLLVLYVFNTYCMYWIQTVRIIYVPIQADTCH